MYAIKHFNGRGYCYFSHFGLLGMAEYVGKSQTERIRKFDTKKEATLFVRQMLSGKHSIVKI